MGAYVSMMEQIVALHLGRSHVTCFHALLLTGQILYSVGLCLGAPFAEGVQSFRVNVGANKFAVRWYRAASLRSLCLKLHQERPKHSTTISLGLLVKSMLTQRVWTISENKFEIGSDDIGRRRTKSENENRKTESRKCQKTWRTRSENRAVGNQKTGQTKGKNIHCNSVTGYLACE